MSTLACPDSVEEFHGPYGPYEVSELVLQRIWLEQAFQASELRDEKGRRIVVENPGQWNRLAGPDFRNAVLVVGEKRIQGDVELHFSQSDWKAHGHDSDPEYDRVVLHVVYHLPKAGERPACRNDGVEIPCVSLLPLLWYSLEEYASEDSIVASTGIDLRPEVEALLKKGVEERRKELVSEARKRWELKCHFAAKRVERLGWTGACHQTALEVLGYAKNRVPMLMVAERFDLPAFGQSKPSLETIWAAGADRWRLSGCRPANHPKTRLAQYRAWVSAAGDWPEALLAFEVADRSSVLEWGSLSARVSLGIPDRRRTVLGELLGGAIGGTRADTLVCDGLLPLLAARSGADAFALWFHWNAGDGPAACGKALRALEIVQPRKIPVSNGWLQGMLAARLAK